VGTVAVAVAIDDEVRVRTFQFIGGREMVKFQAAQSALNMTRVMVAKLQSGREWAERR
jgi:nicotinamide mononucleotide (NMN) deamidase PncC